uniref:Uncharacterized protein n=1 Tax=Clonostachys compactiuscula TaxID=122660 RepID=A0A8F2BRY0_9HYPO|nr:hypothetical protein [Clonostachys compactiuscula]
MLMTRYFYMCGAVYSSAIKLFTVINTLESISKAFSTNSLKTKVDLLLLHIITCKFVLILPSDKFNSSPIFLFWSFFLWYLGQSNNNDLLVRLSVLCFFIFTFLSLIYMIKLYSDILFKSVALQTNRDDYIIIKTLLLILITLNLIFLGLITIQIIVILIISVFKYFLNFYSSFKFSLFTGKSKLNINLKGIFSENNPKNPKNSNTNFFSDSNFKLRNKKKKINKDISKKALEMKEKLLKVQKTNIENATLQTKSSWNNNINIQSTLPSGKTMKRKWDSSIIIEEKQNFTFEDQLNRIQEEYKAYDNQDRKFRSIINNIKKEREEFYPNDAQFLFQDYLDILKSLKQNLKSMETQALKMKKRSWDGWM